MIDDLVVLSFCGCCLLEQVSKLACQMPLQELQQQQQHQQKYYINHAIFEE